MNPRIKRLMAYFGKQAYDIGYRNNPDGVAFDVHKEIPFEVIPATLNEWYADPFIFVFEEKSYIFVEIMNDRNDKRGYIGVTCLDQKHPVFRKVLSEPFHMSYPNVFQYESEIYMIPETNEADQIRLYKAVRFPDEWKLDSILLSGLKAVDTSVYFNEDGSIFAETHDLVKMNNRLFKLDWEKKTMEELPDTDRKYVDRRPGGNFISYKNGTYHALQNCDQVYGKYLHMAKTEDFSENGLLENEIGTFSIQDVTLRKRKNYSRVHTFNRYGQIETVDLYYNQLNLTILPKKIIRHIRQANQTLK